MEVYQITSGSLRRIEGTDLSSEALLEEYLTRGEGAVIGRVELFFIGQQESPGSGGILDVLAVDEHGDVVVIELKHNRTPRDIVSQTLEYAASIRTEAYEEVEQKYMGYVGDDSVSLRQAHAAFFDREDDPLSRREFNTDQRILLIGTEFQSIVLDVVDYLREHDIDIMCVEYGAYADNDLQLLTTESIRRPLAAEPDSVSGRSSAHQFTATLFDGDTTVKHVDAANQTELMRDIVNYLIQEYGLLETISLPYVPGSGTRAIINSEPTHPNGDEMANSRELENGCHILTKLSASEKRRYLAELADSCDLEISFKEAE